MTPTDPGSPGMPRIAADSPPVVELVDVRLRYAGTPIDALAIGGMAVHAGERLFVRGPSGCGKTSLLSLIAGVQLASSGGVRLAGKDWREMSAAQRDRRRADTIGYVFQQFNLLPYLSVLDNVLLPCRFSAPRAARVGATPGAMRATALGLLDRMAIGPELAGRAVTALSVGQQQRVAAARALIGRPALVVADEPTSALDEDLRDAFMRVLLDACAEAGSALVFVSHDRRLAAVFDRELDLGPGGNVARPRTESAVA